MNFLQNQIDKYVEQSIQSNFFENTLNVIWSTSYSSLIYKYVNVAKFKHFLLKNLDEKIIQNDYKIFGQIHDDLILKAGTDLFRFNTISHEVVRSYGMDLSKVNYGAVIKYKSREYLLFGINNILHMMDLNSSEIQKFQLNENIYCVDNLLDNKIAIGTPNGKISCWSIEDCALSLPLKVSNSPIQGVKRLNDHEAVLSNGSKILFWNYISNSIFDSLTLYTKGECKTPLTRLILPYVDPDSILWIGSDGYGVVSYDLKPKKLNVINEQLCEGNTLAILPESAYDYFIISRGGKVSYFHLLSKKLECINEIQPKRENPVFFKSAILKDSVIFLCTWTDLYSFDLRKRVLQKLRNLSDNLSEFFELKLLPSGEIISSGNGSIVILDLTATSYSWKNLKGIGKQANSLTYFDIDEHGNLYAGKNEETILYYERQSNDSFLLKFEYHIPGGAKCISRVIQDSLRFLASSSGLYKININNFTFNKLETKDGLLNQTIYAVYPRGEYLWLSSNSGILRLNPNTMELHQFAEKDGLQGSEFNSLSYSFTNNDYIFYGGTNGVNYFNPDLVKLSEKEVPVRIIDFKINDVISDRYEEPDIIESLKLPYAENTVSFEIISVDFHDQSLTRVKHRLEGIDKDYITSSTSTGIIRYANLDPGTYKLSVLGSNADKVWNKSPRIIEITIVPPFWMTTWFRILVLAFVLASAYKLISDYYKRQLEKKNMLLRQQRLIIEKQQAIEKERTRIAAEMHDDLGSGLTTIRYLSDKAMKHAGNEEEKKQIGRIAEQSNQLVRNMSEIIWAMNSRYDSLSNLISYIRRYAAEYSEEYGIDLQWKQGEIEEQQKVNGEKRRNVFLVVKECLHNIIKHAEAKSIKMEIWSESGLVHISIKDDGCGFDVQQAVTNGNGLHNMEKRMQQFGGKMLIESNQEGTRISLSFMTDQDEQGTL